jgi:putative oxidoreductase
MDPAMTRGFPTPAVDFFPRIVIGGLFIYAGGAKLPDLEDFFWSVHHFALTPWDVSMVLAMFLPWLEIIAGLALIVRRFYAGATLIATVLSAIFLFAVASAWWRGLDITCGCFGKEENATNYPKHLALNGALLLACLALVWMQRLPKEVPPPEPPPPEQ